MNISISRWLMAPVIAGLLALASCSPAPAPMRPPQPGETAYFVPNTNRMLALTFDDGPNGVYTEKILDALKRFNVPATFFLIGTNVVRNPALAKRIAGEGHAIGNHSFTHPRFDWISIRDMEREIIDGANAISNATGVKPTWFRPPYGVNGNGMEGICRNEGLAIAGWSCAASDWNPRSAVEIAEHMITQATPGDILLLHDGFETQVGANRQSTVDAVPLILERLTKEGFRFVTVPELMRHAGRPLAEFANGVRLLGLHVQAKPTFPGDSRYIRYFWDVPANGQPKVTSAFMHFVSTNGFRFQDDHPIPVRTDVRDLPIERVLTITTNTPAGFYEGRIGLLDPAKPDGKRRIPVQAAKSHRKGAVILPNFLEIKEKPKTAKGPKR